MWSFGDAAADLGRVRLERALFHATSLDLIFWVTGSPRRILSSGIALSDCHLIHQALSPSGIEVSLSTTSPSAYFPLGG